MSHIRLTFSIVFMEPFWVGICEMLEDNQLSVCKVTFGAEPKDYEVEEYILVHWYQLQFSQAMKADGLQNKPIGFKRMQKAIKRQIQSSEIGTKAQQALKLQQQTNKLERKTYSKEQKLEEKERQFALRQEKKKQKHRGR